MHCRMAGSISGLYPRDASSDILPCCDNDKCPHTEPNVTPHWGGGWTKNHLYLRTTALLQLLWFAQNDILLPLETVTI